MSNKNKKLKRHPRKAVKPRPVVSGEQNLRMQQAVQAHKAGNLAYAESVYRSLLAEKARTPALFNNLGMVCAQSNRPEEARQLWQKALAIDPRFPDARIHLAASYEQSGDTEKAIGCYQKVLSDNPQQYVARYLLANQLKAQGKMDEAVAHYERVMEQQPGYTQAHFTYALIHKYREPGDAHLQSMLGLYPKTGSRSENRIHLAFALAKAFEDLGDYPRAFKYLQEGNRLRSLAFNYRIDGDEALFRNIAQVFSREAMANVQDDGNESNRPIFIVGMPRSGTSLVEKILASHSEVFGAGELDFLYSLGVRHFLGDANRHLFKPLESYPKETFEAVGKTYLEKIGQLNDEASRITDKLPFNFMMIGLIKIALPNAKIIHCTRDARDTCLSIYKQNFTTQNYRFAYDLKHLGQFHNLYRELMKHWHQVLPGGIYDISYEALTQNPEHEIRHLLEACELSWQAQCLDFDKSPGVVKTASFFQVRQPMYTSSVHLWEKYGEYLQPLFEALDEVP